ncbi:unnamed protein product, partial [Symbiodinium necroappetens]
EESGEPRSRIGFLPRCVDGRPCVLAVLGCLVGSLAFWAAHGGDPLAWKRPGSRLSELVQVWAPAADGKKLEPEVRDDGMLGIPFIESMPEETLPEYGHVKKEEVELGISQLAVARVDCWNPCDRKAGWCHWCGRGRACCRRGADDPAECRGFGGSWRHECVRIPSPAGGQCGGDRWQGSRHCVPGYSCIRVSHRYSECRLAEAVGKNCAAPYGVCGGWYDNAPWENCCAAGHQCTQMNVGLGLKASKCVPLSLLHAGQSCLAHCHQAEGECAWCGAGNACCSRHSREGPLECKDVPFLSLENSQCVAPKYSPAVKHSGQDCLPHCKGAGTCDWCGAGNACCRQGSTGDPKECHGVQSFSRSNSHVCVRPVQKVSSDHSQQDCWEPCEKTPGYCSWCGQGMACCRKDAANDPYECHGVTAFSRHDRHVCVQPLSAMPDGLLSASSSVDHAGRDCWYECGGSGFCSWCGDGNACCRFGAHFDAEECSGATDFSSTEHHVCVGVPSIINKVQIADQRLVFNGRELGPGGKVRGAAGTGSHAREAWLAGVDAIRTWSLQQSLGALKAFKAEGHGLKVAAGIYLSTYKDKYEGDFCKMEHPWWQEQLREILSNVTLHRNDPGLLWWQAGNELELQTDWVGGSECIWRRLEWVVRHIKVVDPNHPVGTAIAGFHAVKVGRLNSLCPSLDFLGLNVYGGDALNVPKKLQSAGWTRPYAITEFGAAGAWMTPRSPWKAPMEPTSSQKAIGMRQIHQECLAQESCLGTFAFMWGWKFEHTPTWFSTFNEWRAAGFDEPASDVIQAMQEVWTGRAPRHPAPKITAVKVFGPQGPTPAPLGVTVQRGAILRLDVSAVDMPNNDDRAWENNDVVWVLTSDNPESPSEVASAVPGVLQVCQGSSPRDKLTALVPTEMLEEGRAYRLYAFVRDHVPQSRGQCLPPRDGSECDVAVRWILSEGTNLHADWYPGLSPASSYSEVQDFLNKRGKCPRPCPIQHGVTEAYMNLPFKICHDATFPEPCAWEMRQLKNRLMNSSHGFPGLSSASSFQELQAFLHAQSPELCPAPCDACEDAAQDSACGRAIADQMQQIREPLTAPFSGVSMWAGYSELQSVLERYDKHSCPQPCALRVPKFVQATCPSST